MFAVSSTARIQILSSFAWITRLDPPMITTFISKQELTKWLEDVLVE